MDGVRFLAQIVLYVAWATLILGVIAVFVTWGALSGAAQSPQLMIFAMPALMVVLLGALGPFFLWGVLHALDQLYRQNLLIVAVLEDIDDGANQPNHALPASTPASRGGPRSPRRGVVSAPVRNRSAQPEAARDPAADRTTERVQLAADVALFGGTDDPDPDAVIATLPAGTNLRLVETIDDLWVSVETDTGVRGFVDRRVVDRN